MSKKELTAENVSRHCNKAIGSLDTLLQDYVKRDEYKYLKKADLLAYWIEDYSKYLYQESGFNYTHIPRYKRGNIISVNFGFNVGSELGGLHYAIVLDNKNFQRSPVLTVIPLSSGSAETTNKRDIFLGNELYEKLYKKYDNTLKSLEGELNVVESLNAVLSEGELEDGKTIKIKEEDISIADLKNKISERLELLKGRKRVLQNVEKKNIDKLKNGSIALLEQITTISKMRILKPKTKDDLLYGISFSDGAMDKINTKLIELFIYTQKNNN